MEFPPESSHERRAFGLRLLSLSHPQVRSLKKGPQPHVHGHRTWNATWLLIDFLRRLPLDTQSAVLDIGCGWGLAGIYCARRGARVTGVDLDPAVFPYLHLHARLNDTRIDTLSASFGEIDESLLAGRNLLIGADICFNSELISPLFALFDRALQSGLERIVIADPGRRPFRRLAALCVRELGAVEREWEIEEPLLEWPGATPKVNGFLLLLGSAAWTSIA